MSVAVAPVGNDPAYLRGCLLVLLASTAWSFGGLLFRGLETAGAWQYLFHRALATAVVIGAMIAVREGRGLWRLLCTTWRPALEAGTWMALSSICYIFALAHTTVANASFMISTVPFLTALGGWLLLGERIPVRTWIAMGVVATGIAVMVGGNTGPGRLFGNVAALSSAVAFAGFSLSLRRYRHLNMLPAMVAGGLICCLMSAAGAWLGGEGLAVSTRDLSLAVIHGGVLLAVGLSLYSLGARSLPAADLTLLSMSEFILSPVWVWLVISETPSVATLVGGAIVFAALIGQVGGERLRRPARGRQRLGAG